MANVAALSYSSISTYLECPLRWKFLYVDRLPEVPKGYFTFGRTVHAVLEELLRPYLESRPIPAGGAGSTQRTLDAWATIPPSPPRSPMSESELLALYDRLWKSDGFTSDEEERRYRALGRTLLLGYRAALEAERPRPVAVEAHLETDWDGIPVHGYVDRIDRTDRGGLAVLDYKTSRELTPQDARDSDQLTLYQVLVERNFSEPVEELTLYHLRSLTPLASGPRTKSDLEELYQRAGNVLDGIRADAFEPTPGRHCARCDFRDRCPEFRTPPSEQLPRLRELADRFRVLRAEERRVDRELRETAEELHRLAEALGIHRIPGSNGTLVRRREEQWKYSPEGLRTLQAQVDPRELPAPADREAIRALLSAPGIPAEIRRKVAASGVRERTWYWDLEEPERSP